MLLGIDISSFQAGIQLGSMPIQAVIIKATEGLTYISNTLAEQARQAIDKKLLWGLYHYARPDLGHTPQQEAKHFVRTVSPYLHHAVLVLDWERDTSNTAWAKAWLDEVTRLTGGIKPWLYASASPLCSNDWRAIAPDYGVWVAGYLDNRPNTLTTMALPSGYKPGQGLTIVGYQYTSTGRVPGYDGNLDLNNFYLTPDQWAKYASPAGTSLPIITAGSTTASSTVDQLADAVIKGSYGNGADRVKALGSKYAVVQAIVNKRLGYPVDVDQLADAVIKGSYGNGADRVKALGSIYREVQAEVNKRLSGTSASKSVDAVAREVIAGKWGNGQERANKLAQAGYSYSAVQARVNTILLG